MILKNLYVKNFRNYIFERFEFGDGLNLIVGENAQGKTNCAEAAFLLATGFSPRAAKDKTMITYGEQSAELQALAANAYGNVDVKMTLSAAGKRKVLINGVEIKRAVDLLGNIHAVFFNPDELKLIKESPEDRRRFMDVSISQRDRGYYLALLRYRKILEQRNNLLKNEDRAVVLETLPVWDEQLSFYAAEIMFLRGEFAKKLSPLSKSAHAVMTDGEEELFIEYACKYSGSREEIQNAFYNHLLNNYERDIAVGFTLSGPHRDDLKIFIDKKEVKHFASQGQQRTAAISLKLAELEIFKERYGEYPLLILDDALSELDVKRQAKLLSKLDGVQTIITCTDINAAALGELKYKKFIIEGGKIV